MRYHGSSVVSDKQMWTIGVDIQPIKWFCAMFDRGRMSNGSNDRSIDHVS